MKLFHQFYFVLYQYFYNRPKYITNSGEFSSQRNASRVMGILLFGWILLLYFLISKIFNLEYLGSIYGKYIIIVFSVIVGALVYNYFTNYHRHLKIYDRCVKTKVRKSKIIFLASLFFCRSLHHPHNSFFVRLVMIYPLTTHYSPLTTHHSLLGSFRKPFHRRDYRGFFIII